MAQTQYGAMKVLAEKIGIPVEEYERLRQAGQKWCFQCEVWKPVDEFNKDASRYDGRSVYCRSHRLVLVKKPRGLGINPLTGKPGPVPIPFRDGDKRHAREKVHSEIRNGRMPSARTLPCTDCGHRWVAGGLEHHYDHYLGYSTAHHLDVQAVCASCHARRDSRQAKQTHCIRGHEFTKENTIRAKNGTRHCRECRRAHDRGRRDAAFWREYRRKRKANG